MPHMSNLPWTQILILSFSMYLLILVKLNLQVNPIQKSLTSTLKKTNMSWKW